MSLSPYPILYDIWQDTSEAPAYATGYYLSEKCQPTTSESRIFASYMADQKTFPKTERDMVRRLQQYEKVATTGRTADSILVTVYILLDPSLTVEPWAPQPCNVPSLAHQAKNPSHWYSDPNFDSSLKNS